MRNKIVGVVVLMLVATTVVSATNINLKDTRQTNISLDISTATMVEPYEPGLFDWWNVDQKQTQTEGTGVTLYPPDIQAQSFTPTKDKLTAISLWIFKHDTPPEPVHVTVSIRDNLTGSDLATKTIDTSVVTISSKGTWVLFDFEDISVTPGNKYYILCSGDAGAGENAYCWLYSANDTYTQGDAYYKENNVSSWNKWIPGIVGDFCFKTYFRKPLDVSASTDYETLVSPLTHVNMKEKINPLSTSVDVPVWKKGDSWTYDVHSQCYTYDTNGTIYSTCLINATEIWTVTAVDNDNYTVQRISKNISGIFFYGPYRWIFTKYMKLTEDDILQKTNLAQIQFTSVFKGLVRWLIGKHNFSIPAQFTVSTLNINSPPDVLIPFPLSAGTNGTLPNVHTTGYQKCTLYWGLIKAYNLPNLSGYTGIRKYTCKMENITVPADTYNSYNISVTYSTHNYWRSYYVPDIGNFAKRSVKILWGSTFKPYLIQEWDLVSTTYTP